MIQSRLQYFLADFQGYILVIILAFIIFIVGTFLIFRSNSPHLRKRISISFLFTFFFLVLLFCLFEGYFRYIYDEPDGLGFLRTNGRWYERHVVYNADFFRDRNFSTEKKLSVFRIGVLGDSITFGAGIDNPEDRFSNKLEKKFQDAGYTVEVYNLGLPGHDTHNELAKYPDLKKFQFDMIVWQYFLNDAQPRRSKGGMMLANKRGQTDLPRILSNNSYFFDYVYWRLAVRYDKTFIELSTSDIESYKDKDNLDQHKEDVGTLSKEMKEGNRKILVIIFPYLQLMPNYSLSDIHSLVKRMFHEQGIETIDLVEYLKGKKKDDLVVGKYDNHPNEYVHTLAAEKLYKKILPTVKEHRKNNEDN